MLVVIVIAVVLGGLANDCAYAGPGCSSDDCALEAAAKDSAEDRPAGTADKRAFARTNAALAVIVVVVVVVMAIVAIVVVAAASAVAHAAVVGAVVVVVLRGKKTARKQERGKKGRISKLAHFRLDAGF
jgi:hypothetical protein